MRFITSILIFISSIMCALAQQDSIKLEFFYPEDTYAAELAEFQGVGSLSFKIIGNKDAEYDVYAVMVNGNERSENKLNLIPINIYADTVNVNIFAKALSADSVSIGSRFFNFPAKTFILPTENHLLIESLSQSTFSPNDDIPLFAYSTGIAKILNINGMDMKVWDICGLRYSGKPMTEWDKHFDLEPYILFILKPSKDQQ